MKKEQSYLDYSEIDPVYHRALTIMESDIGKLYKENCELQEVVRKYKLIMELLDNDTTRS